MQFKHRMPLSEMEVCHVLKMEVLTLKAKGGVQQSPLFYSCSVPCPKIHQNRHEFDSQSSKSTYLVASSDRQRSNFC